MNVPLFASLFYFSLTVSLSHSPSMINSKAQLWEKSRTHRRTGVFMEPDKIHSRNHKMASTVHTHWLSLNDQCSLGDLWASSIFVVPHITKKTERGTFETWPADVQTQSLERNDTYHTLIQLLSEQHCSFEVTLFSLTIEHMLSFLQKKKLYLCW